MLYRPSLRLNGVEQAEWGHFPMFSKDENRSHFHVNEVENHYGKWIGRTLNCDAILMLIDSNYDLRHNCCHHITSQISSPNDSLVSITQRQKYFMQAKKRRINLCCACIAWNIKIIWIWSYGIVEKEMTTEIEACSSG